MIASDVIGRVKTVEIPPHFRQLSGTVFGQRLVPLIRRATRRLCGNLRFDIRRCRQLGGPSGDIDRKTRRREAGIVKPATHRLAGGHRQAMAHDVARPLLAHSRRQQVGPELGAIEVAHVLVVRVKHHAITHPDDIRRPGEEAASRAGVATHSSYGQP